MFEPLGVEYRMWITAFGVAQLVLGSVVTLLAFVGYARNRSRSMLLLGAGVASLTVLPVLTRYALQDQLGIRPSTLGVLAVETVGLGLVLASILEARRN